jgi:MFS family permease
MLSLTAVQTSSCNSGLIPSLLPLLKASFALPFIIQGIIGGVTYLTTTLACMAVGKCFKTINSKAILMFSLVLSMIACIIMISIPSDPAYSPSIIVARIISAMSQSFLMVWAPMWVDNNAPSDKVDSWYSSLQSSVPIGITLGYSLGMIFLLSSIEGFIGSVATWKIPFIIQLLCLTVATAFLAIIPSTLIDIKHQYKVIVCHSPPAPLSDDLQQQL